MNVAWHNLSRHLRIGYVSLLLFVDGVAILLISADLYHYVSSGLSLYSAFSITSTVITKDLMLEATAITFSLAVILPILIAVGRVVVGTGTRWSSIIGIRRKSFNFLHITLSAFIGCSSVIIKSMQVISGYTYSKVGLAYAFNPSFQPVIPMATIYLTPLGGLVISLLTSLIVALMTDDARTPNFWKGYNARCLLADLGGDLYPVNGRRKLNFNAAAVAPEIHFIKERTEKLALAYQRRIPGSKASFDYLAEVSARCKEMIGKLILTPEQQSKFAIEFLPGTSRAIEIALAKGNGKIGGIKKVVLSPFEHPIERKVVEWYSTVTGCEVEQLHFSAPDYSRPWADQMTMLKSRLNNRIKSQAGNSALILSQVCYATGMVIPVGEAVTRVRELFSPSAPYIIVDGAHYVGNGHTQIPLDKCDAYVFSAHKWLLSPEPCGIIISPKGNSLSPYDAWRDSLPTTTASVRSVASLFASLELLDKVGFSHLWMRSAELRDYFSKSVSGGFEVVGENTSLKSTFLMTIQPKSSYKWKDPRNLDKYLQRNIASVFVMKIDRRVPWIRVAFPYFLEFRQLKFLSRVLLDAIEESK